jgi:hypothetical protein
MDDAIPIALKRQAESMLGLGMRAAPRCGTAHGVRRQHRRLDRVSIEREHRGCPEARPAAGVPGTTRG